MELRTLESMVRAILEAVPRTRDDDRELTLQVYTRCFGVNPWSPVSEVMRDKKLPSQESIGRCRRKIQETDMTLRGTKHKEKIRMDAQEDFLDYARG